LRERPELSLIIPMHSEAPYIAMLRQVCPSVLESLGRTWELIVVDDGSIDETAFLLGNWAQSEPRVRSVRCTPRQGKTHAYATAFARVQGAYIFTLDADLQEDLSAMAVMLERLQQGVGWHLRRAMGRSHGSSSLRRRA